MPRRSLTVCAKDSPCAAARGFTLVEMLVSTAIVLLMLVMFAQIYQGATSTVIEQRGLAQTDARARMLENILRSDLRKLSYRQASTAANRQPSATSGTVQSQAQPLGIVPLFAGDRVDSRQRGYLYIAENDPTLDTEDVLQFTVFIEEVTRDPDTQPFVGRAAQIGRPAGTAGAGSFNAADLNQPDYDDGVAGNGATRSRAAEIVYFLRAGVLYRRVLLLRDPLPAVLNAGPDPSIALTNAANGGEELVPGDYDNTNADLSNAGGSGTFGDFWNDFDLSAVHIGHVHFNSIASLNNALGDVNEPIALPEHRFGFRPNGQPREFITGGTSAADFFGRFTHRETSHEEFSWPAQQANNPLDTTTTMLGFDATLPGRVIENLTATVTYDGPRAGEDILMTNVDAFDVKVWDAGASDYVDIGGTTADDFDDAGPWHTNDNYGAKGANSNVFDTWHPEAAAGSGNDPPYRIMQIDPADASVNAWVAADPRVVGQLGIPATGSPNGSLLYRVVATTGTNSTGDYEPLWPLIPGETVQDGEVTWMAFDNRVGLKMIQITIRFRDPGTNASRQLTVVHSFVE
jgi:prepilin-type N-terminal cleavage/methylation domain-containing protein